MDHLIVSLFQTEKSPDEIAHLRTRNQTSVAIFRHFAAPLHFKQKEAQLQGESKYLLIGEDLL